MFDFVCVFVCIYFDYDVFIVFYNSIDGVNWMINIGWVDGVVGMDCDLCLWYGVICDGNNRVICLDLDGGDECVFLIINGNNLMGILLLEIGVLD